MRRRFLTFILLLGSLVCAAQSLTVEAPGVVTADETFRVTFTADGKMSDFNWEGSDGFEIVWGPQKGSMSSTSIVNGKRTSVHQETVTYLLQPKAEGKFTIPSATATVSKKECSSRQVTIEVVAAQSAGQQQSRQRDDSEDSQGQGQARQSQRDDNNARQTGTVSGQDLFLKFTVSKTNVVKGEPITATLKIYTRADISAFEDIHFPTFNGFWSKETVTVNNLEFNRENVNGTIYNSALLRKYMLVPQQTGNLTIDPAEMVCQVRVRTSAGSPMSIFDDFFDQYQTIRKRISTAPVTIKVKELPTGAPESFAGGVGNFKIAAEVSKKDIKSNDAASLTVTISGTGNISMLEAPDVDFPSDFEVYDIKKSDKISGDGMSGSKSFEFPFIPRSHGDYVIPSIEYSYYDYTKGKYVTVSTGDIPLKIAKGEEFAGEGVVVAGSNRQAVKSLAEDIRYIALGSGNFSEKGRYFAVSPMYFILLALLVALYFIVSAVISSLEKRRADVVGSRNRRANKMARARLRNAENYLKQNLSSAYYEELHKALLGYVSDKLAIPAADLSKDSIREKLSSLGVKDQSIEALTDLIDKCEFARYSPDNKQAQMENEYNDAINTISELEGQVKRKGNSRKTGSAVVVAALLLMAASFDATAQNDINGLWSRGNDAFASEQWQNALNFYQMIEGENLESPELYYNIGNTYFKMGDNAHAILYFEKALRLDPDYDDAANNLAIARQFTIDKIDVVPEFILKTWTNRYMDRHPADVWAWISLAFLLAAVILALIFKFAASERIRKVSFITACVAVTFAIISFIFSVAQKNDVAVSDSAIVTSPVSSVKSSPAEAGKTVFVLHEGTKILLLDNVGEWSKISLSDGRQGWISTSAIEVI